MIDNFLRNTNTRVHLFWDGVNLLEETTSKYYFFLIPDYFTEISLAVHLCGRASLSLEILQLSLIGDLNGIALNQNVHSKVYSPI